MNACFVLAVLLLYVPAEGYTQSAGDINAYRRHYIEDLYPIIKDDTSHIRFFPENPGLAVEATVVPLANRPPFKMVTSSGTSKEAQQYALLQFRIGKKDYQLYAYQLLKLKEKPETAKDLFLPFIDATCGRESYGGGRYIDLHLDSIKNGKIRIDFNKAYNPYCAFTTGYNCPVPPRENALPVAIRAGERYQKNKFHREQ